MPHANTEDQLVEQPAIQLFATLGWETVSASDEVMGPTGTLGRETTAEVVLMSRLRAALERLNPTALPEAVAIAIESLTRNRATMSLVAANRGPAGFCAHSGCPGSGAAGGLVGWRARRAAGTARTPDSGGGGGIRR